MIRKLARLFRRIIRIQSIVDTLTQRAGNQTADLMAHGTHCYHDLVSRLEEKTTSLQSHLNEQLTKLAAQIAAIVSGRPGHGHSALAPELQTLERLVRGVESREHFGLSDLCELEALSKQGLFIAGNARSGTSILLRCLNLSKDVYLLGEANLCENHSRPDFQARFREQHQRFGNPPMKDTFIPEPPVTLEGGMAHLAWLARHYRYVGEKVAFGAYRASNGVPLQDLFFEFQARFFFLATYFAILRTPTECVWSMHKKYVDIPIESLIESWLRSVNLCVDLYAVFPNCYLIFFDNLGSETIARISQILQTEIPLPPNMLNDGAQRSRLPEGGIPKELSALRKPLHQQCTDIYEHLKGMFSPQTLRYDGRGDMRRCLVDPFKLMVADALDSIVPGGACLPYRMAG